MLVLGLAALAMACNQQSANNGEAVTETFKSGKAVFVADESFAPVLDQELYIFKAAYEDAHPSVLYKPENDLLRAFLNDSVRVAIMARKLTPAELKIWQSKQLPPEINCFAHDGVALIVNQSSADTLITTSTLKKLLNGQKTNVNLVFDNPKSSIVRYLKDFSGNATLQQKNIFALKSNVEVIKYVSEHNNTIGVISYTWLLEPDSTYATWAAKVKMMGVADDSTPKAPAGYFKPSQNSLAMREYPLVRDLYIINSTGKMGLGTGFASFLESDRGQRIILRSGLLPDSIPTREISIRKTILKDN